MRSGNTQSTSFLQATSYQLLSVSSPRTAPPLQATSYKLPASSFGLVEVVVGVSILGVSISVLFGVIFFAQRIAADATTQIQATLYMQEGAEAARYFRDLYINEGLWDTTLLGWGDTLNKHYCISYGAIAEKLYGVTLSHVAPATPPPNPCPSLTTGSKSDATKYVRTIQFSCATRSDQNDPDKITGFIACSADGADKDTVRVTTSVAWTNRSGQTQQGQLETIITNR